MKLKRYFVNHYGEKTNGNFTYYSDTHARLNIQKVNDNHSNKFDVTDDIKHVFWWRKKKVTFGIDQFDFHGDCIVDMMSKIDKIKEL